MRSPGIGRGEEERPAEQVEDELGWARSGLGLPKLLGLATMADQSEIRIENFLGWARSGFGLPKLLGLATMADQSEIRIENFLSFFQYNNIKKKEISRGT